MKFYFWQARLENKCKFEYMFGHKTVEYLLRIQFCLFNLKHSRFAGEARSKYESVRRILKLPGRLCFFNILNILLLLCDSKAVC